MKKEMKFHEKIIEVIRNPTNFFEKIKKEKDLKKPLIYFIIINIIILGLWRVRYLVVKLSSTQPGFTSLFGNNPYINFWITWVPVRIGGVFITAYILHLCIKLFTKKKHKFIDAFKILTYGETPYALLGWAIPVVFGVRAIILYIKGIMQTYKFSVFESICVLVLSTILGVIATTILTIIITFPFVG